MSRGAKLALWPLALAAYVVAMVVVLAVVTPFEPQTSAAAPAVPAGDAGRGEVVYARACAACHGLNGEGGVGPALAGSGLTAAEVARQVRTGGGAMPPALVTGRDEADVAAFVAQLAG